MKGIVRQYGVRVTKEENVTRQTQDETYLELRTADGYSIAAAVKTKTDDGQGVGELLGRGIEMGERGSRSIIVEKIWGDSGKQRQRRRQRQKMPTSGPEQYNGCRLWSLGASETSASVRACSLSG